jgi:hypothetical protein
MSGYVRVNGKMTDAGGEYRMHVSAVWRGIRSTAVEKSNLAHRTEIISCYEPLWGQDATLVSGGEAISEGAW